MTHDHAARLRRAEEETEAGGLDALIISPSPDLVYLAGYGPMPQERLTALLIRPGRDRVLVVPELERPQAAEAPIARMATLSGWRDGEDPMALLGQALGDCRRLGVSDHMRAAHLLAIQEVLPDAAYVPASRVLAGLRARKDPGELHLLGRVARAADAAFHRITREGFEGRQETDVGRMIARFLEEAGHDRAEFIIVGSGPNGAAPHHEAGERTIRAGDVVVLDFGGPASGYYSDVTRTVCVGEPSAEVKEVHDIVRRAQEAAFHAVRPGVPAQEVDRAARRVIEEGGYGDAFIHRTGHGIGLEVHEAPYIVEGNAEPLEPGMCFSIEPGIYLEGRFGVRIEDIVAVTADGAARLNHAPRDLLVVG